MTTIFQTGPVKDTAGTIFNVQSPKPPFAQGVFQHTRQYIVTTDFTSGEDVIIQLHNVSKILWYSFNALTDNAIVAGTETSLAAPYTGKILTVSAPTASFRAIIITDV